MGWVRRMVLRERSARLALRKIKIEEANPKVQGCGMCKWVYVGFISVIQTAKTARHGIVSHKAGWMYGD